MVHKVIMEEALVVLDRDIMLVQMIQRQSELVHRVVQVIVNF